VGAYLQGSFALGAGDAYSDADFVVAVHPDVDASRVPDLDAMHGAIHDLPEEWAQHLEGSYVPVAILRRAPSAPVPVLFLNNGSRTLERSEHDNTSVVRWVLRERGIVLCGPSPRGLVDPVAPEELRADVRREMRQYGSDLLAGRIGLTALWQQGFVVLYYCRALQTLATATVASKPAAMRWAAVHLDPRWSGLIARSWEQRTRYPRGRGAPERHDALRPPPEDVASTLEFVGYALDLERQLPS
jgi:hypothetical protein